VARKVSREVRDTLRRRGRVKLAIGLNTGVAALLALALLAMVNYLSFRHYARIDISRTQYYTLSEKTLNLIGQLSNRVDIIVFFTPQHEVYEDLQNLLKEYEEASPLIRVEQVDPHRDLARTEMLAGKYDVDLLNVVVVDYQGRTKYLRADDIVETDFSSVPFGEAPEKTSFKGELSLSSAIHSVTQERTPVVYFLQGHGERDVENFDQFEGYSEVGKIVRRDNLEVKNLVLGENKELPADADALVVAGPQKRFAQPEVDLLNRYLHASGRVLLLLDAAVDTGLEPLLEEWGIRLRKDVVIDSTRTITGRELFVTTYGTHPITRGFNGLASIFYFPRSVTAIGGASAGDPSADQPRVTPLAASTDAGWAETDLDENPMRYDPLNDAPGPVSVAVAVERGPGAGIDVEIRPTRLVVMGDSDFLSNGVLSGGNSDFMMSALNWLLERESLLGIAPKQIEQVRLVMSRSELSLLFWVVVVGWPAAIGVLGVLVWARRRS